MYNLLIQHYQQPPQHAVSSFPSQQLCVGNQTAVVAFSSVPSNLCIITQACVNIQLNHREIFLLMATSMKSLTMGEHLKTNLQRGTWHSDSLHARACSWRRYHILLQRRQPPEARVLHCIPWRKRPLTLRQFGYWHCGERHWEACTRRSSILRSCKNQ